MAAAKRILFLGDAGAPALRVWVAEMAARRFDCVVASRRPQAVPGAREVIGLRPGDGGAGWFTAIPQLHRLARRLAPQWVHGHGIAQHGLWAAASGVGPQVPVVLTALAAEEPQVRGWSGAALASLQRWSVQRAALVTAGSAETLAALRQFGAAAGAATRWELVQTGLDTALWQPGKPAAGCGIAVLGAPMPGADRLLGALARLRAGPPAVDAWLQWLAGAPDDVALLAEAQAAGLSAAVRPLGVPTDAARLAALQRARVAVDLRGAGAPLTPLLEAMACGLPVVALDSPLHREWLGPAGGPLLSNDDPQTLADAVRRLHDDTAAARAQGQRHREQVLQRANRRQQMERMAVLYDALRLKAPRAPAP